MPSFVFVRAAERQFALDLAAEGKVPQCKPFVFNGQSPTLFVEELAALELAQAKAVATTMTFGQGTTVEVIDGLLGDEQGTVVKDLSGHRVRVKFSTGLEMSIPAFLLRSV
jgi:hypothetical protein